MTETASTNQSARALHADLIGAGYSFAVSDDYRGGYTVFIRPKDREHSPALEDAARAQVKDADFGCSLSALLCAGPLAEFTDDMHDTAQAGGAERVYATFEHVGKPAALSAQGDELRSLVRAYDSARELWIAEPGAKLRHAGFESYHAAPLWTVASGELLRKRRDGAGPEAEGLRSLTRVMQQDGTGDPVLFRALALHYWCITRGVQLSARGHKLLSHWPRKHADKPMARSIRKALDRDADAVRQVLNANLKFQDPVVTLTVSNACRCS